MVKESINQYAYKNSFLDEEKTEFASLEGWRIEMRF